MNTVDHKLCGLAIDMCGTQDFEGFVQAFHAAMSGSHFVPLGGMHDGGADGYIETILGMDAVPGTFLQASKTPEIEKKIAETVARLRNFGRLPKSIHFYFSEPLPRVDTLEERLSLKYDVFIRIRGKSYMVTHINNNPQTVQAFSSYLRPAIIAVMEIGKSPEIRTYPFESKTMCAFLGQEIERRRGNASLLTSLTDSLIIWSLEGTDPQKNIFLSEKQIYDKIVSAIPSARQFIKSILPHRLSILRSKSNESGREINWHSKTNVYALRYEERQKLILSNAEEIELFNSVSDEIKISAREMIPDRLYKYLDQITQSLRTCIEQLFYKQGISLGKFIHDASDDDLGALDINDEIDAELDRYATNVNDRDTLKTTIVSILRSIIYHPTEFQRQYMLRLSSTYFVLFALKNEPRVIEYFNSIAQNSILYIGSDLLIKALSEYHLNPENQMITNTIKALQKSGSKLVLAQPALEEVFSHIHASILEFENHYSQVEHLINEELVSSIDRILIRAYFYARLELNTNSLIKPPKGWMTYIGQFGNYQDIRRKKNIEGLRHYLCDRFGLDYETRTIMQQSVDRQKLKLLMSKIVELRSWRKVHETILAHNDALHALRVHTKRLEISDNVAVNPFGYRVWWLTHEQIIQRAAAQVLGPQSPRFIMRPEFLLNYVALMPTKREIIDSYRTVFPTILGVTIGRRAPAHLMHTVLESIRTAMNVDESRAKAIVNEFSDKLKSDALRVYEVKFDVNH